MPGAIVTGMRPPERYKRFDLSKVRPGEAEKWTVFHGSLIHLAGFFHLLYGLWWLYRSAAALLE